MPQYLKLQPHGEALTFEDGNVTLVESRKILRHIADKYKRQGNPDLIGMGALERSSIEQWLQTEAQSFDVPSADMIYSSPTCRAPCRSTAERTAAPAPAATLPGSSSSSSGTL
ncbi:hypothetical protein ZWY2020_042717 [Hordeum vulgare]|nr:hypothetical protein ZWY2020_042717 [Hordeum vulgare]